MNSNRCSLHRSVSTSRNNFNCCYAPDMEGRYLKTDFFHCYLTNFFLSLHVKKYFLKIKVVKPLTFFWQILDSLHIFIFFTSISQQIPSFSEVCLFPPSLHPPPVPYLLYLITDLWTAVFPKYHKYFCINDCFAQICSFEFHLFEYFRNFAFFCVSLW